MDGYVDCRSAMERMAIDQATSGYTRTAEYFGWYSTVVEVGVVIVQSGPSGLVLVLLGGGGVSTPLQC